MQRRESDSKPAADATFTPSEPMSLAESTAMMLQTQRMLRPAQQGDREAQNQLVQRYEKKLLAVVAARVHPNLRRSVSPEDIVQDTFMRALRNLPQFEYRGVGSFWAYLRQIAIYRIREEARNLGEAKAARSLQSSSVAEPVDRNPETPQSGAMMYELKEAFDACLEKLDVRVREALLLRVELGLEYAAIAEECGFPSPDAARMAVKRALAIVMKEMAESGFGEAPPSA